MHAPAQAAPAEAADGAVRASKTRRVAPALRQLYGFAVVLLVVVILLGAWAYSQEVQSRHPTGQLWGEVLFLGVMIWLGLVALSPILSRFSRRLSPKLEVPRISTVDAAVWATAIVVGLPIATHRGWLGFAVPVAASALCYAGLTIARRRTHRVPHLPVCFSVVFGVLALLPFAWWAERTQPPIPDAAVTAPVLGSAELAAELRPVLFFDRAERFSPIDIDDADVEGCRDRLTGVCESIAGKLDEIGDWDYLKVLAAQLDPGERPGGPESAIYYHVLERGGTLHVDYWWYFAHNPAPVARSVLCGGALTRGWLGTACAEHPADWEGMTLVLRPTECADGSRADPCVTHLGRTYVISEAQYAQHEKVVAYPWTVLQRRWRRPDLARWAASAGARPLVFVALSSHASYATPCGGVYCRQLVHTEIPERRDGGLAWANNWEGCRNDCIQPLPTDPDGRPAAWNAFRGRWGTQHCILFGSYCDTQRAPLAPAFQPRYRDPCPEGFCIRLDRA